VSGPRRVIVGTSGSPGNLCALRYAEHLARTTGATLIPVHAWTPLGGDIADRRSPNLYLRRVWAEAAWQRLWDTLAAAWGPLPADLPVTPVVQRGEPAPVLTIIASRPGDVLVIGAGRRGPLTRIFSGRVSRYCLAHAQAPVVAIPPPALTPHIKHSPLRWAFWRRQLTPDRILHGGGKQPPRTARPRPAVPLVQHPGSQRAPPPGLLHPLASLLCSLPRQPARSPLPVALHAALTGRRQRPPPAARLTVTFRSSRVTVIFVSGSPQ
jgi:nucleotide-binding universal stress UspA family protein